MFVTPPPGHCDFLVTGKPRLVPSGADSALSLGQSSLEEGVGTSHGGRGRAQLSQNLECWKKILYTYCIRLWVLDTFFCSHLTENGLDLKKKNKTGVREGVKLACSSSIWSNYFWYFERRNINLLRH